MAKMGWLGFLLLVFMGLLSVDADRMRPSQTDVASSLQDPKYKIDFHSSESPVLPTLNQETIVMTDRDGKKFRCNIPVPESTKTVNEDAMQQNGTSTSLVADGRSSRKTPEDLLDALKDKCFRRYEGWWIYELCYKGHLRQFHLHDNKAPISTYGPDMQHGSVVYFFTLVKQPFSVPPDARTHRKMKVQEFVLGTYDAEATAALHENSPNVSLQKDPRSQSAAQRYHAHVYTNGTICDLTNQPRETEVRFVCLETGPALINSIKEAPTCKYIVVFHTPMLCKHPAFQEERQPWVVIDCNAVPSDVVPLNEGTTAGEPSVETSNHAETDSHQDSVTPALAESKHETPLLSLPQDDPILTSQATTKSGGETEVSKALIESSKEIKINEEAIMPSEESHKVEEPATDHKEEAKPAAPVEEHAAGDELGEGKGAEELAIPGHQREEHPTA